MGSRPPFRRAPSRSPPPAPPASSSSSPPPSTSTGGKIIRLSQRPGDSTATPSRAEVTLSKPLRPSLPSRSLKRPAPHPPRDPNLPPPTATVSASSAAPPVHRAPPAWKRRLTLTSDAKKVPPPEEDKSKDVKPVTETAKPHAVPDEDKTEVDASTPAVDREEQKAAALDAPDPPEDAGTVQTEDDLATAFEAVIREDAKYSQAQNEWICEGLRGIRDDITKVAESGDRAALSQLLKMTLEGLIEPAEGHLKVIAEAVAEIDALVDGIRKKQDEEATIAQEGDEEVAVVDEDFKSDRDREGDEDTMEEDGSTTL